MLSVIIPTWNAARSLPNAVASIRSPMVGDVIVADGGSTDDTVAAAREAGARIVAAPRGRGAQLHAGAQVASHGWLLFLHADTRLGPGWEAAVRRHQRDAPDRAGYFRFRFDQDHWRARLVARSVALRCAMFRLPYGDQGLFMSRTLYEAVGGFRVDHPLMEDVDIVRRLGRRLRPLGAEAITSAQRYEREGYVRRALKNLRLLSRYLNGASPAALARDYA